MITEGALKGKKVGAMIKGIFKGRSTQPLLAVRLC